MGDYLVGLGRNRMARRFIGALGLPLALPQELRRTSLPWEQAPLEGALADVASLDGGSLAGVLQRTLAAAGARTREAGDGPDRPSRALVFDATPLTGPDDLRHVYAFFQPRLRSLDLSGRVLLLARSPADLDTPAAAAAIQALEGFVRSLAKEIGRRGATAHLVQVAPGAERRVEPLLRFLLSPRSAYLSGQVFRLATTAAGDVPAPTTRPLEGRVALVTGAARGIGAATARALAREGAHVVVVDLPSDEAAARALAEELGGSFLLADVTAPDTATRIDGHLRERWGGRLDVVVHNAGITRDRLLANLDAAGWDTVLDVNLASVLRLNDAFLPRLSEGARLVFLSSVTGIAGNAGQTNYSASKAGLIGYVRALAPRLASRGITVNALAPGFIETRMTDRIPFATREAARRLCNLGQGGLPEDVAEAVTFLSSPGASGLTGSVVRVCGGSFIGA